MAISCNEPALVEYGIQCEKSDIRAHVGVWARSVYVFPTRCGAELIQSGKYISRPAFQAGVIGRTALGYCVPICEFPTLRTISVPALSLWDDFHSDDTTSTKGKTAVAVVLYLLKNGRFPMWIDTTEDDRTNVQVKGTDILLFAKQKIQVKCDYRCGTGHLECTGNLYLQTHEANPLHLI